MKSPETSRYISRTLARTTNRSPVFPILIAYAMAMRLPLLLDTNKTPADHFADMDTHVIDYTLDALNIDMPIDLQTTQEYVKHFYTWRHSIAQGIDFNHYTAKGSDIFSRFGGSITSKLEQFNTSMEEESIDIQANLLRISTLLGELNDTFKIDEPSGDQ